MAYREDYRPRPAPERRPPPDALAEINRLEDERGCIWRRGVTTQAAADRLAEINRALSALWQRRRVERAGRPR